MGRWGAPPPFERAPLREGGALVGLWEGAVGLWEGAVGLWEAAAVAMEEGYGFRRIRLDR